jgi:hypothetical protein
VSKEAILERFSLFYSEVDEGITRWLGPDTDQLVFDRLDQVSDRPISHAQLKQLLHLSHIAGLSPGFFTYYWLSCPSHTYDVEKIPGFEAAWVGAGAIVSLDHLYWGLYRLYVDGLLYFGNVRAAYRHLRGLSEEELGHYFKRKRFDKDAMKKRGAPMPLREIARDNRYLISEMACKAYDEPAGGTSGLKEALAASYKSAQAKGLSRVKVSDLLSGAYMAEKYKDRNIEFQFAADDIINEEITSEKDLDTRYAGIAEAFSTARDAALVNTRIYLSMVDDLDVYVATSMRNREDFRQMAATCDVVFNDPRIADFNLRYFDPTVSAASGHEDKGLIECLMVKCAKALVYCAGARDSYGKDAEAAMALSLGKPVIFYCTEEVRGRFYREVHPLSRLIEFSTGVAVGAMVTSDCSEITELLSRIFFCRGYSKIECSTPWSSPGPAICG